MHINFSIIFDKTEFVAIGLKLFIFFKFLDFGTGTMVEYFKILGNLPVSRDTLNKLDIIGLKQSPKILKMKQGILFIWEPLGFNEQITRLTSPGVDGTQKKRI